MMRKLVLAAVASGMAVLPAVGAGAADLSAAAAGSVKAPVGRFERPFREDGGVYRAPAAGDPLASPNGTITSAARGDDGCAAADPKTGHKDCLSAGASMIQLANGRVLYWNAIDGEEDLQHNIVLEGGALIRNEQSRVLTLGPTGPGWTTPSPADGGADNTATAEAPLIPGTSNAGGTSDGTANDGSLFCSDQVLLADGRVLTVGGTSYYSEPKLTDQYGVLELEGIKGARIFDPATNRWSQTGTMRYGRWYPSLVTLADGKVLAASGVTKLLKPIYPDHPADSGTNVKQTETWDPTTGAWSDNTAGGNTAAARSLPLFPRLHLLPNGNVYYDAAGQDYNPQGQSYDEALWNVAAVYDPTAKSWHDVGVPGAGTAFPGFRGSTFSAALPLRAPYTSASYLTGGGVLGTTPGSYVPVKESRITTVGGTAGKESMSTVETGDMGRSRWYSTGVPLPTGQVLAVSGGDLDEVVTPGSEAPIRTAEIFTPTYDAKGNPTGGTWRDAGDAFRGRTYHNNAVLMPDGRVLVGGHAPIANGYGSVRTNPSTPVREGDNNSHDASFEIYNPPYLTDGSHRPDIGAVPASIARGGELTIPTKDAANVKKVVLMRNTAQTHLVDGDARTVELPIVRHDKKTITVVVPSSASVVTTGPYMVFLDGANKAGDGLAPSEGRQVFVGTPAPRYALAATRATGGHRPSKPARAQSAAAPGTDASAPSASLGTASGSALATGRSSATTDTVAAYRRTSSGHRWPAGGAGTGALAAGGLVAIGATAASIATRRRRRLAGA